MSSTRREFIKSASIMGAALVSIGLNTDKAQALPAVDTTLHGVIETHVHTSPDVSDRAIDALTYCQNAKRAGMRGAMLKCHAFPTCDYAVILRDIVPGFEVFGSIVLNDTYGDKVNVKAAELAVKLTGGLLRCIWMPTNTSEFDRKSRGQKGIPVVSEHGQVLPEVVKVMEICAENDIIFATGHCSPAHNLAMAQKAHEIGLKKCIITHPTQIPWDMNIDDIKRCIDYGCYIEHCFVSLNKKNKAQNNKIENIIECIKFDPDYNFINTDFGQTFNPNPVAGMKTFMTLLKHSGLKDEYLNTVARKVPAYLMGLDSI